MDDEGVGDQGVGPMRVFLVLGRLYVSPLVGWAFKLLSGEPLILAKYFGEMVSPSAVRCSDNVGDGLVISVDAGVAWRKVWISIGWCLDESGDVFNFKWPLVMESSPIEG